MITNSVRNDLHDFIDNADDRIINALHALAKTYMKDENEIAAYSVEGNPITRKEYIQKVKEAEKRIETGKYLSQDQLEKETKNWL